MTLSDFLLAELRALPARPTMSEWLDRGVVYCRTTDGRVPADEFLDRCPDKVEATILAVLEAVRRAPPPAFSGGGKWEAMHGAMGGYYEIRVTGPGRRQYRLFCRLENGTLDELAEPACSETRRRLHGQAPAADRHVVVLRKQRNAARLRPESPLMPMTPHEAASNVLGRGDPPRLNGIVHRWNQIVHEGRSSTPVQAPETAPEPDLWR